MSWHLVNSLVRELRQRCQPHLARLAPWLEPLLGRLRRLPRRALVLGGVGLLALGIALAARARLGPEDAAPTDQFLAFYCPACGQTFQLSHREFEQLWNARGLQRGSDGQSLRFKCQKCGKNFAPES